jgi:hypothetical protein
MRTGTTEDHNGEDIVMKLVLIIGSGAVGKMTVGQALMKKTGLRLFHNHMTIEPTLEIFGDFNVEVIKRLREVIFEEFVKTDKEGLIFTVMWAFDEQSDWDYVNKLKNLFESVGGEVYFAELIAPEAVRLERNRTENRLKHKASKRNLEFSDRDLIETTKNYRVVSLPGEIPYENYIRIDNSNLSSAEAAQMIKERFNL